MAMTVLTVSSKNYSSWALRGWLLCKMSGLEFKEHKTSAEDISMRAELLLLSPSCLVPSLEHMGTKIWDTFAIAEYLNEIKPKAKLYPAKRKARAHCRSVSGEMHSGFFNLRSALPMNLRAHHPGFKVWAGARPDIARISEIWRSCLETYGGPFLFGESPTVADAMYAPVCTRFRSYDVSLDAPCASYRDTVLAWPVLQEWVRDAAAEPDDVAELEVEF